MRFTNCAFLAAAWLCLASASLANAADTATNQINLARRGLTAAEEGLHLSQQRQEFGVGMVLENVQAEQDVTRARTVYLRAIAEFDKAQYELSGAAGTLEASPARGSLDQTNRAGKPPR
ncbi:MAG: TolC family protein [Verrucomicrobiota bacterium]